MKWLAKKKLSPRLGDERWVRRFAWLPTRIGDYTVWLGFYMQEQVFDRNIMSPGVQWHSSLLRLTYSEYQWMTEARLEDPTHPNKDKEK